MTTPAAAGTYTVRIVNDEGVLVSHLPNATVDYIEWNLNAPMTASISVPVQTTQLHDLISQTFGTLNELQVWRDGAFFVWLVPTRIEADATNCVITCSDPLWYFTKRYVGRLYDVNLISNPEFETGITGWTAAAEIGDAHVGGSINAMSGSNILAVHSDVGASVNTNHVQQSVTIAAASSDETYVVSAYSWVEPLIGFIEFQYYPLGLVAMVYDDGGDYVCGSIDGLIRNDDSKVFWTRKRCSVKIPPHAGTYTMKVYLMSPTGKVYYDYTRAVKVEALRYQGTDQAAIFSGLVSHAQDTAIGKADLNITASCPSTTVYRSIKYPYAAHDRILDVMQDLAAKVNGPDFAVECTATTRTFKTYYPQKGSLSVTLEWGVNVAEFTWSADFDQAASSVAVTGDASTDEAGDADDVEHLYASDSAALGGKLLEYVEPMPSGPYTYISAMQLRADETLTARKRPIAFSVTSVRHATDFADMLQAGTLTVGDTASVDISHGIVNVDEQARITSMRLTPATEQVAFTLVPGSIAS